jgi:1,4-dihydroxy-2-naphthoate octaprenyltransferase
MIFGEIASLIFEGLFELMISVYLTFQVTESENFEKTKVLSYMTIACIILVVLVALPIALTWLIF